LHGKAGLPCKHGVARIFTKIRKEQATLFKVNPLWPKNAPPHMN